MSQLNRKILKSNLIELRPLMENDYSEEYLSWLEDEEINRYLETRWEPQSEDKIRSFIKSMENSDNSILFGIFLDQKHVGNIKIGPVNCYHLHADVSYFIGSREAWGKGLATEAVGRVTQFAFEELELNKCNAGVYSGNPGSSRVLEKVGYKLEGCLKNELKGPAGWEDHLLYGYLREEYE
ncbi:MAG: GNAT family N-acetyltransferase [Legionellales bacterium]|nr:GNAT family N-acetyltransferase [Legionellales bacterium]